jgi:hypothetical protein
MARLRDRRSGAEAKASVISARKQFQKSFDVDTKPSDLSMTRLKQG